MAYDFLLSSGTLSNGRTVHYAQRAGTAEPKFVIGYRTNYLGNFGLFNTQVNADLVYKPADFTTQFGFWAHFIYPTSMAESQGSYLCLNTYDRAKCTFSFMQYGAHVPNGDFVKFLRKLLALPKGLEYFPKLSIQNGRINYRNSNGTFTPLESDASTQGLMDYFNPNLTEVDNQELICAARLVHWATKEADHRKVQVETAIEHFRSNMISYDNRFNLHNVPAKVCQVICDIRHQGRGMNDRIAAALNTGGDYEKAYKNLLTIGDTNYASRINTVKTEINKMVATGIFNKKYNRADNSFVNA